MSTQPPPADSEVASVAKEVVPPSLARTEGISVNDAVDDLTEKRVDEIEMIGEEVAAGLRAPGSSEVSAGMRYLHCSRTIHQLVTDRNRAVGLYLAVATVMWTASTALLNARPSGKLIIPIEALQEWCLPVTFGTLTVLALFVSFLLIRTRVGLIYEVAKMNVLLGLPVGRVKRVNPLSLFFIMHLIISLAGGASGALFAMHLLRLAGLGLERVALPGALIGVAFALGLTGLYVATVLHTTSDRKLRDGN